MIPILELTADGYAAAIHQKLGKGKDLAKLLYSEWFRLGTFEGNHPAFNNAKKLLEEIKSLTYLPVLEKSFQLEAEATVKLLLKTKDGFEIESVIIPMEAGGTLCISSQVGCKMGCRFCETGRMGLLKNLTVEEIVGQVFYARHIAKGEFRNVVFMGMGEPFDNYEAVMQAFRVINDPFGLNVGAAHITISTSGKADEIIRFSEERGLTPHLAVSITAPNNALRDSLVPLNKKHNLEKLIAAIGYYQKVKKKSVLIAYVLLKEVNDQLADADELAALLQGLDVKVNLIPYNPQSNDRYSAPDQEVVKNFKMRLVSYGLQVLVRQTRGDKIMAACGQLGKKKSKRSIIEEPNSQNGGLHGTET